MYQSTPAHKQTDPAKAPGQIVFGQLRTRQCGMSSAFAQPYGGGFVSAEEKMAVASIGTSNALGNDGIELEGSTCD